jgi:hypothetical protein
MTLAAGATSSSSGAQEGAAAALPEAVARFGLYLELHRALLVQAGDRRGGVAGATEAMAGKPVGSSSPALLVEEIQRGADAGG